MKLLRTTGSQSHILQIFIKNSSVTTGAGLTGLTNASAGLTSYFHRNVDTTATAISLVDMTVGTFTSGGFKEIDATNMPGYYQFCPPDSAFLAGATSVVFHLKGATNMTPIAIEIDLAGDIAKVAGTTQSAGDIYAGINAIGSTGALAINTDASANNALGGIPGVTSGTTMVGTQTTGTYASASFVDGVYNVITGTATNFDVVYQFLTGGGTTPTAAVWTGILNSNNDNGIFYAWNHVGGVWEEIGTLVGQTSTTVNIVKNLTLYPRHSGTSVSELGKVYIRIADSAGVESSPVLRTDQIYVSYSNTSRSVGYANGAIWINTSSGITGTEPFVNGTADKPCLTLADALTLSASTGLKNFQIAGGSTITLASSMMGYSFIGEVWTLNLAGQDISKTYVHGAEVSGTGVASTGYPIFEDCELGTASLPPCELYSCALESTTSGGLTCTGAGNYNFFNCRDEALSAASPIITMFSGACNIQLHNYSGHVTVAGMTNGSDYIEITGRGTITLPAGNTAGTVLISGNFDLLNSGTGQTITQTARISSDTIRTAVGMASANMDTQFSNIDMKKINGNASAASNLAVSCATMLTGTAITGTLSTTQMTTDLASTTDNFCVGRLVVFTSGTLIRQVRSITGYLGTGKLITMSPALATAPTNTDTFIIV